MTKGILTTISIIGIYSQLALAQPAPAPTCKSNVISRYASDTAAVVNAKIGAVLANAALDLEQEHQTRLSLSVEESLTAIKEVNAQTYSGVIGDKVSASVEKLIPKLRKAREKAAAAAISSVRRDVALANRKVASAEKKIKNKPSCLN